MIVFDSKHLAREIHDFKEYFTFYRIFVFYSDNEEDMEDQISVMRNLFHIFIYDALILHVLATQNNAISIQWISNEEKIAAKLEERDATAIEREHEDLLDWTFGQPKLWPKWMQPSEGVHVQLYILVKLS